MAGERVVSYNQVEFDVVEVADSMGWQLPVVKRGLRQLQWSTDRGWLTARTGMPVNTVRTTLFSTISLKYFF